MTAAGVLLSGDDVAIVASDMHLGDHDPATARQFLSRLDEAWPQASHLLLLGDLFEAWVGDDQPDAAAAQLLALLRRIGETGRRVWVMRGNRDFLLDEPVAGSPGFSRATGATLLEDPCPAVFFGEPVVLAHGDALCTGDTDYQALRQRLRAPAWRHDFLSRPLAERLAIAREMRARSEAAQAGREPGDVAPAAVDDCLRALHARVMIHGHTHRPGHHVWMLDDAPAHRWVLSDWDAAAGRGGFLRVDRHGISVAD